MTCEWMTKVVFHLQTLTFEFYFHLPQNTLLIFFQSLKKCKTTFHWVWPMGRSLQTLDLGCQQYDMRPEFRGLSWLDTNWGSGIWMDENEKRQQKISWRAASWASPPLKDNQKDEKPAERGEKGVATEVWVKWGRGCPRRQRKCHKEGVHAGWLSCYHNCHSFVTECSQEPCAVCTIKSPNARNGSWGSGKWNNFPKVTQLMHSRVRIWIQVCFVS